MPWGRFDPISNADAGGIKNLNDMLRYLFAKVQGGLTRKELASSLENVIDAKAEAAAVNALGETVGQHTSSIAQNAAAIALRVTQAAYDGEKPYVGASPPESPEAGRLWLDTSVTPNLLKQYNGSAWETAGTDALKTAGLAIDATGIALDGPTVDISTQTMAIDIVDGDDTSVSKVAIDANGVSAERVNADV
ncbi:MAG: hypothetical protein PHD32_04715, partial [Eubacteriales bacterium]|nr:hypothetical protein [Eubacteriales bacterium]